MVRGGGFDVLVLFLWFLGRPWRFSIIPVFRVSGA